MFKYKKDMDYRFKVLLLGIYKSGKTTFLKRISENIFDDIYRLNGIQHTIITYKTNVGYVEIDFLDVPGIVNSENEYYSLNDAVIFFYDINEPIYDDTFKVWIRDVYNRCGVIPYFIVETHIDSPYRKCISSKYDKFYISSKTGKNINYFLNHLIGTLTNNYKIKILSKI